MHKNVFTVGWLKTGPKGIVDSTLRDSLDTAQSIQSAISNGFIVEKIPDFKGIIENAKSKGVRPISYDEWKIIDEYEIEQGKKICKLREKIIDMDKLLSLI